jgi:hypothetical protein
MRVRAIIPYLQKYVPGNPSVVSEFMPGGGGRKAANYIYRSARPDGLTMGNIGGGMVLNAVLGEPGVQYDLDKLNYLGASGQILVIFHLQEGWDDSASPRSPHPEKARQLRRELVFSLGSSRARTALRKPMPNRKVVSKENDAASETEYRCHR